MHLLVIEDDPRLSRLLRRLLEEDRHVVELAMDGVSGVEIATAAPGIEAIVLDVGLPDISGLEVARRVRASGSDVSILMLTARDTVGDRVSGLDAGADDYLVKPFAYEELAARLRALGTSRERLETPRAEARRRPDHPRRDGPPGDARRQDRATSPRASSRCSSASSATPARPCRATSSWTRPGRSAWPSPRTPSTPTSTTSARSWASRAASSRPFAASAIGWPMPDGAPTPTEPITGERAADIADAGLIRRVRRNLVLWSGGTTLVILLVLAVALYLAVAGSLANSGTEQLEDAMVVPRAVLTGQRPDPGDTSPYEFQLGSPTFAFALDDNDHVIAGPRDFRMPPGLPDDDAVAAARANGSDLRTATVGTNAVPVRILTEAITSRAGPGRHRPGRPGPHDRGPHAAGDAGRAADRRDRGRAGRVRLRCGLRSPGAGPDPRVARQPADGAAPPARLRGRCQPRAADAAHGRAQQRRVPQPPPGPAGPRGRVRARRHRRRGPPHDRDGRGPAAAGPLRLRARSPSTACRSTSATSPRTAPRRWPSRPPTAA